SLFKKQNPITKAQKCSKNTKPYKIPTQKCRRSNNLTKQMMDYPSTLLGYLRFTGNLLLLLLRLSSHNLQSFQIPQQRKLPLCIIQVHHLPDLVVHLREQVVFEELG
ncbi:unnamed protein product, partial [Linum tenue]